MACMGLTLDCTVLQAHAWRWGRGWGRSCDGRHVRPHPKRADTAAGGCWHQPIPRHAPAVGHQALRSSQEHHARGFLAVCHPASLHRLLPYPPYMPSWRVVTELIIKPCPLAARICCPFSPALFSSVQFSSVQFGSVQFSSAQLSSVQPPPRTRVAQACLLPAPYMLRMAMASMLRQSVILLFKPPVTPYKIAWPTPRTVLPSHWHTSTECVQAVQEASLHTGWFYVCGACWPVSLM